MIRLLLPTMIFLFLSIMLLALLQSSVVKAQTTGVGEATFTKTDTLVDDLLGNGQANPGDTLRYDLTIDNPAGADLTNVTLTDVIDSNLTWSGVWHSTALAFNNTFTTTEGTAVLITMTGSDPDGDTLTFSILTPPSNGSLGAITPQTAATANVLYTPTTSFTGSDSFTFQVMDDDGNTDSATITITVDPAATPPVLDLDADDSTGATMNNVNVSFTEGGGAVTLNSGISIVDAESTDLVSGVITLTNPLDTLSETLAINTALATGFGINVSFGANNHSINLSGSATLDEYRQVLETVTYNNTDVDPDATVRLTTFVVNDGQSDSNIATANISITPVNSPPTANDDNYNAVGNTLLAVGVLMPPTPVYTDTGTVLGNDTDPEGNGLSVQSFDATSANGGVVNMQPDGTFTYLPPIGFEGTDTFTYTMTDGIDTDTATVTITVADVVWYIDHTALGGGDGRSQTPFNSIVTFNSTAVDDPGDIIFLFEKGGGNYSGGITLLNNQQVIGQGVDLVVNSRTLVSATTNPILTSGGAGLTLAQNNVIRGLNIGNTGGSGLFAPAAFVNLTVSDTSIVGQGRAINFNGGGVMDLSFDTLSSSGGTNGIIMTSVTGSLSANQTVITNTTTGSAIWVSNSAATFDFGNTSILNSGLNGVELLTSSGSTFIFDSLSINTSGNTGLLANNAGTITVLGSNNVLNATGGTAVNLTNTTIGTSGITFRSVSASGAANGIILNNTGSGAFTVTGSGTTDGSGGTIANITQRSINLTNAQNISLRNMVVNNSTGNSGSNCDGNTNTGCFGAMHLDGVNGITLNNVDINGTAQQGINGVNVANLALQNSTITNCGNAVNEHCVRITNLTGASSITNSDLSFGAERVVLIQNTDAANLDLTVTGSTFRDTQSSGTGDTGLEVDFMGDSTGSVDVSGSNFLRNRTTAVQIFARDSAEVDVDLKTSTFDVGAGIGRGPEVGAEDNAIMTFEISNNPTITARGGVAVSAVAINSANLQGAIENNSNINMNNNVGAAILVKSLDNATGIFRINNNIATIGTEGFGGIQALANEPIVAGGTATLDATISSNVVNMGSAVFGRGIQLTDHSGNRLCANITGNNVIAGTGSPEVALNVEDNSGTPIQIEGFSTTLDAMWTANGNTTTIPLLTNIAAGSVTSGNCATPNLPMSTPLQTTTAAQTVSGGKISEPTATNGGAALIQSLGTIPAGKSMTISFEAMINDPFPDMVSEVSNQGQITADGALNMFSDDPDTLTLNDPTMTPVTIIETFLTHLPIVLNNFANLPDLVVDEVSAGGGNISITIRNAGNAAVTDDFWVDVYFNPTETPSLNKPWNDIADHGAVWGITADISAGDSLVLTVGDTYYRADYSSARFPAGAQVYAFVDSINYNTTYGVVYESNENNNLSAPVTSTLGGSTGVSADEVSPAGVGLPER